MRRTEEETGTESGGEGAESKTGSGARARTGCTIKTEACRNFRRLGWVTIWGSGEVCRFEDTKQQPAVGFAWKVQLQVEGPSGI